MTRFVYDQFSKDYLEELLKSYGTVEAPSSVAGEVREIDVYFSPLSEQTSDLQNLGLLGRFASISAIFEPFRNPASTDEILDCILKLLEIRGKFKREAKAEKRKLQEIEIPKLWILTPTAFKPKLSLLGAVEKQDWLPGIYFMAEGLRTAIVVIHQLPVTQETIWLRILGRDSVQQKAIEELSALPASHPFKDVTLQSLYNLRQNLAANQQKEQEDRELMMRLQPLYQQDRELAKQEGQLEGQRLLIIRLITRRFGSVDSSLIEQVRGLPVEQLENLANALLDFSEVTQLVAWLNQQG
ncbi:MAG: DUF4351 domain-containing protein [Cyanomargarita calcarea GSE-NOS-MK-12-04C]|jgi:hypothetical protein|uniref:DUF4351 domain-containing protein n=1 Tax=Cyanomargarita calcarea GSE-NOS-MK-12-04C TaxID=2839659 RepID=A0A951QMJ5_9CYAN|nr:DUF4351 domain-containing protein [Cyanomargarita calcarea GSE-NOS-MK-12-04C]